MGCKSESDASKNRVNSYHIKTIQTKPEQHTEKERNQERAEKSHIGHCARTAVSATVQVQSIQHGK